MKITESRLKEIIKEELNEQGYTSKIASFLKSLRRPGDAERRQRAQQRLQAAEPEEETPSRVDLLKPPRSTREIQGSKNYKKFMASLLDFFANQMQIDIKIAKKIVRDIRAKTPASGEFNKLVFKEQMENEIDIAAILANSGLGDLQQIKVLGALKRWAAQNSDLIDDKMTTILKLRDKEAQKAAPDPTPEPAPDTPADPAPQPEPVSEPSSFEPPPEDDPMPIDIPVDWENLRLDDPPPDPDIRLDDPILVPPGEDEEETEQIKPVTFPFMDLVPPDEDEEEEEKPKYRKRSSQDYVIGSTDEGINRKDQVIVERWQVIAGIDKKVL